MLLGGFQHISSDPMKAVNEAMEDSTDWITSILTFMTNLVAPEEEEEEGILTCCSLYLTLAARSHSKVFTVISTASQKPQTKPQRFDLTSHVH